MDPKQTLLDAFAALKDRDYERFADCMDAYARWRSNGGFDPSFDGIDGNIVYDGMFDKLRKSNPYWDEDDFA